MSKASRLTAIGRTTIWRWRRFGVDPKRRSYERKLFDECKNELRECLLANPTFTSHDVARALREQHGIRVSSKSIRKFIKNIGFSRKRTKLRGRSKRNVRELRKAFCDEYTRACHGDRVVVSVDECAFSEKLKPFYGYSPIGEAGRRRFQRRVGASQPPHGRVFGWTPRSHGQERVCERCFFQRLYRVPERCGRRRSPRQREHTLESGEVRDIPSHPALHSGVQCHRAVLRDRQGPLPQAQRRGNRGGCSRRRETVRGRAVACRDRELLPSHLGDSPSRMTLVTDSRRIGGYKGRSETHNCNIPWPRLSHPSPRKGAWDLRGWSSRSRSSSAL